MIRLNHNFTLHIDKASGDDQSERNASICLHASAAANALAFALPPNSISMPPPGDKLIIGGIAGSPF